MTHYAGHSLRSKLGMVAGEVSADPGKICAGVFAVAGPVSLPLRRQYAATSLVRAVYGVVFVDESYS